MEVAIAPGADAGRVRCLAAEAAAGDRQLRAGDWTQVAL